MKFRTRCATLALLVQNSVDAVWARGKDVRVLVQDAWRLWDGRRLGKTVARPPTDAVKLDSPWQASVGSIQWEIRPDGVYRCERGKPDVLVLADERLRRVVASADGRWLLVARPGALTCLASPEGREVAHDLSRADVLYPVAWIPARRRFLVWRGREGCPLRDPLRQQHPEDYPDAVGPEHVELWLLDPATGTSVPFTGEAAPFVNAERRPMQSASTPGKMWTALPSDNASPLGTDVGLFDPAEFTFRVIAHYPDIRFTSDSMWVDEEGGFVYVADEVGLLRLPFGGVHPDR